MVPKDEARALSLRKAASSWVNLIPLPCSLRVTGKLKCQAVRKLVWCRFYEEGIVVPKDEARALSLRKAASSWVR